MYPGMLCETPKKGPIPTFINCSSGKNVPNILALLTEIIGFNIPKIRST